MNCCAGWATWVASEVVLFFREIVRADSCPLLRVLTAYSSRPKYLTVASVRECTCNFS
jgi:hypothetical protein